MTGKSDEKGAILRILNTFSKLSLVLVVLIACVALKIVEPAFLTTLQLKWFDIYQNAKPRTFEDLPVKIVDIDDASLAKIGQWPWPRTQVAELVRALGEAGAAVIAFDIVFAEPDRTSPKRMQQVWQLDNAKALSQLPDHDDVLAKEIAKWPVVLGSILSHQQGDSQTAAKTGMAFVGGNPTLNILPFSSVVSNLPVFETAALGNGMLNSDPDADGVLRKVPLLFRVGNTLYPSLAVEVLRVAQGASSLVVKSVGAEGVGEADAMEAMKIGAVEVPTDAVGKFWVYYDHTRQARYIPAWQVMAGAVDEEQIAGRIILIGTSAPGLKDLRATPLTPSIAGVEVHAQVLEQMLQGLTLLKPDWGVGAEILLVVVAGLLALWISSRFAAVISALGLLASLAIVLLISWFAFDRYQLLLEPITAWVAIILVYFTTTVWRFAKTEHDKSQIRNTFGLYVSKDLVDKIAENPDKLKLGGEKKDVSILFCDIRNFSAISEHLDPAVLTKLINGYLTPMTDIILGHGGTIDKYMGDAIMAIWNAPLHVKAHPEKAVQAALTMRNKLHQLNNEWQEELSIAMKIALPVRFGIGINSGECSVGNMGSTQRFEYSVLGHEVDLASRLEGLTKYYGMDIIISERTHARIDDVASILLDTIRVKGKEEPINIYGILADAALNKNVIYQDLLAEHQQMLAAYKKRHWKDMEGCISQCRLLGSHIPLPQIASLYNLYESRIQQHRLNPPGDDWDGVFDADFK